ncbi:MAG: NPCBM/NEW2 domain-containing protein [Verrucomicrobiota bacterium]
MFLSATQLSADVVSELAMLRKKMNDMVATSETPLKEWDEKYLTQLKTLADQARAEGDLDRFIVIREEQKEPGAKEIPPSFTRLKQARAVYWKQLKQLTEARKEKLTLALHRYRRRLLDLQKQLTREDKLDLAVKVREELQSLSFDPDQWIPGNKPWRDLLKEKYTHAQGSSHFMKHLNADGLPGAPEAGGRGMNKVQTDAMLTMHTDGRLDYTFDRPITEFRATIRMLPSRPGDGASFEVRAGGQSVFSSETLFGEQSDEIRVTFPPTRELSLHTHKNRTIWFDHCVWENPEIR